MRKRDDEGFGLVEMVIAFFLLSIIAVAILPALWNGILNSSRQSDTASATRQLNALVESARQQAAGGSCVGVDSATSKHRYRNGIEIGLAEVPYDFKTAGPPFYACVLNATNTFTVTATDSNGIQLASVTATVLVNAAG